MPIPQVAGVSLQQNFFTAGCIFADVRAPYTGPSALILETCFVVP